VSVVVIALRAQGYTGRLSRGHGVRAPVSLLVSSSPAFVLPALFVAVAWWLVMRGDAWVNVHSREISASFIARFHWSDVGWLFRALPWVGLWLRGVVARRCTGVGAVDSARAVASTQRDAGRDRARVRRAQARDRGRAQRARLVARRPHGGRVPHANVDAVNPASRPASDRQVCC